MACSSRFFCTACLSPLLSAAPARPLLSSRLFSFDPPPPPPLVALSSCRFFWQIFLYPSWQQDRSHPNAFGDFSSPPFSSELTVGRSFPRFRSPVLDVVFCPCRGFLSPFPLAGFFRTMEKPSPPFHRRYIPQLPRINTVSDGEGLDRFLPLSSVRKTPLLTFFGYTPCYATAGKFVSVQRL